MQRLSARRTSSRWPDKRPTALTALPVVKRSPQDKGPM